MTIGATWPHRSGGTGVTDIPAYPLQRTTTFVAHFGSPLLGEAPAGLTFTVRVRDQTGARNTEPFSIRINPPRPVAISCQQGGLFQMEPEPGTRERNTLGDGFEYTNQPQGEERLCFTNGRVPGYDSPQLATLISNDAKTATWRVQAGGRIGMVIGEDAVEGGCSPQR